MFDFKLVHVPGERHKGPGALSRRGFTPEEEAEGLEPLVWIDDVALLVEKKCMHKRKQDRKVLVTMREGLEEELDEILQFLVTLKPPREMNKKESRKFTQKASQFFVQGLNMFKKRSGLPPQKVIFPAH